MATGTSRRVSVAVAIAGLALTGCGSSGSGSVHSPGPSSPGAASLPSTAHSPTSPPRAFAWLVPRPAPAQWSKVGLASGATLSYPPGWQLIRGDRGTATVAQRDQSGRYVGYLNLTPRQGDETLANWGSFRVAHNREEGERNVRSLAGARQLRFRSGSGSCVQDTYTTSTGARYLEIACLVSGRRASSVIVGAAPPEAWAKSAAEIERAISGLTS